MELNDKHNDLDDGGNGRVFTSTRSVAKLHTIYMPTDVSSDDEYEISELCHHLRSTGNRDAVLLYLANFGGSCHAGQRVINAMADCSAPITVIMEAPCYSMGALIAISGDKLVMHQGTFLMFHNYSAFFHGKGGELRDQFINTDEWLKQQQYHTCYPFLSKKEIKLLEKDQDIYISCNDQTLDTRCERHFKYQEKYKQRVHTGV